MSEHQLYFRHMQKSDLSAVEAIEAAVFSCPWSRQAFLQAMQQDTLFVVVLEQDRVVGYCGMYCSFEEGEITNVAVSPQKHHQGIGRSMMKYLLSEAQRRGICRIILEVRISNQNAIDLYKSLGFENCGIRKNFYEMPREDGMVMVLEQ